MHPAAHPEEQAALRQRQQHALLTACIGGDREAFRDLFLRYQDRVYSIALHFTADRAAAMDIAQDVFVKLFSSLSTFRHESSFEAWLFRLTANCCHDRHRKQNRLVSLEESNLPDSGNSAIEQAERLDRARQVQRCVARLPVDLRMTVILRYTEGLSYEEIATILACPAGTIASRLNRAHRELAVQLEHLKEGV